MANNIVYSAPGVLKRITKPTPPNFSKLFYAPVENILTTDMTARQTDPFSPDIVGTVASLITCKGWYLTALPNFKKSYKEEQKDGDSGPYMEVSVEAFLPSDSMKNHMQLDRLKYHRFILLVVAPGDIIKIIGSLENPVSFSHVFTAEGSAGSVITFKWSTEDKPLIYNRLVSDITPVIK